MYPPGVSVRLPPLSPWDTSQNSPRGGRAGNMCLVFSAEYSGSLETRLKVRLSSPQGTKSVLCEVLAGHVNQNMNPY